ncbi:MAG: hemerythrin domain-containing protein, partial [Psychrobium sp.]
MENITYDPKWNSANNEELIEHILKRYHQVHRQQFSELIELATTVESVHSDHPQCPTGLAQHLKSMESELISHMEKEERILFPM